MRRANRIMRPANLNNATRSMQTAMAGFMIRSSLAPLAGLKRKRARRKVRAGKSLGVVQAQLRAARSWMPGAMALSRRRGPAPEIPAGAQYLSRRHSSADGARGYKLYLPASAPKRPRALILMLHGCTQTPDDFAIGTHMNALAEKHGLAIAYPAQTRGFNAASCWNWFEPGDQTHGAGEPAILASLAARHAIPSRRCRRCAAAATLRAWRSSTPRPSARCVGSSFRAMPTAPCIHRTPR
ncbi:MAG: hypothetical protein JJT95_05570 [Pararhodobacter sp.]|nr:hypothetical protein [Pararhodobacter sp.]